MEVIYLSFTISSHVKQVIFALLSLIKNATIGQFFPVKQYALCSAFLSKNMSFAHSLHTDTPY